MSSNDDFQDSNAAGTERPNQPDSVNDDYISRTGQSTIPVQSDSQAVEAGGYEDGDVADSDAQLQRDDADAIDKSNIIEDRTRGAAKASGTYTEPGDEEGLGDGSDGRSRVAGGKSRVWQTDIVSS